MANKQQAMWETMNTPEWQGGHQRYLITDYLMFYASLSKTGKTAQVAIFNRASMTVIGHIKWFGRWRQYAFFPEAGSVWNTACLAEIEEEIAAWKATRG